MRKTIGFLLLSALVCLGGNAFATEVTTMEAIPADPVAADIVQTEAKPVAETPVVKAPLAQVPNTELLSGEAPAAQPVTGPLMLDAAADPATLLTATAGVT